MSQAVTLRGVLVSVLFTQVCAVSAISMLEIVSVQSVPDPLPWNGLGPSEPVSHPAGQWLVWRLQEPVQAGVSDARGGAETGLAGDRDTPSHCHRPDGQSLSSTAAHGNLEEERNIMEMQI